MEVNNILDVNTIDNVSEVCQLCECSYNGETVEFRIRSDELLIIDDIEIKNSNNEWVYDLDDEDISEDVELIVGAINNAPYQAFHKKDVGATLKLNHVSIKEKNELEHFATEYYVDNEGPIVFTLKKNVVILDE